MILSIIICHSYKCLINFDIQYFLKLYSYFNYYTLILITTNIVVILFIFLLYLVSQIHTLSQNPNLYYFML